MTLLAPHSPAKSQKDDVKLDIAFPVVGQAIPIHHGYRLFSALSKRFPYIHSSETGLFGVAPIKGRYNPDTGLLDLTRDSCIRIRTPKRYMRDFLSIAGKALNLITPDEETAGKQGWRVRVGTSRLLPIRPSPALSSQIVLPRIRFEDGEEDRSITPERFMKVIAWQMEQLGVAARAGIPLNQNPQSRSFGEPARRSFEIKGVCLTGYALELHDLSDEDSIKVQEQGLGGKRSMGCGLFDPLSNHLWC